MAPAVANPLYMGYKVLYKNVLETSKRGIAKALRVFADKDNYPILLHCIHGEHTLSPCTDLVEISSRKASITFGFLLALRGLTVGDFAQARTELASLSCSSSCSVEWRAR